MTLVFDWLVHLVGFSLLALVSYSSWRDIPPLAGPTRRIIRRSGVIVSTFGWLTMVALQIANAVHTWTNPYPPGGSYTMGDGAYIWSSSALTFYWGAVVLVILGIGIILATFTKED